MATYGSWQATIQNEFGDILPSADVEVILESTGLPATIYSGRTGGALANPFAADINGFAQFYAAPGEYRVTATDSGSGFTNTWRYVEVGAILANDATAERITGKNYLINANRNTTIINQDGFGGGQPAAGVYGYDLWRGDALGTREEQTVENSEVINEIFTISWVGGTGTADVDGVTGLNSGDSFTLNTSTNFSVIVPTDATYIVLNKGEFAIPFPSIEFGLELVKCQRFYESSYSYGTPPGSITNDGSLYTLSAFTTSGTLASNFEYKVEKISLPAVSLYNPLTGALGSFDQSGVATPANTTNSGTGGVCAINTGACSLGVSSRIHYTADSRFY